MAFYARPGHIASATNIPTSAFADESGRFRSLEESAALCRELALQGLFVGPSSGAYVKAAYALALRGEARTIVTVLNDGGERYGSTGLWGS